jgi:hypothetical protein
MPNEQSFGECADHILNAIEEAFDLVAIDGRETSKQSIIKLLRFYFIPKEVPGAEPGDIDYDDLVAMLERLPMGGSKPS